MPKGVYVRSEQAKENIRKGRWGDHVKKEIIKRTKKVTLYRQGDAIECKIHGFHTNWRVHNGNNVQCRKCASDNQKRSMRKYPIKYLVKWAKARKLENFDLDEDHVNYLIQSQDNRCALSGIKFDDNNKPSLDRIDSTKGYTKGNVQIVVFSVNRMKSDMNQHNFVEMCKVVSDYWAKKK